MKLKLSEFPKKGAKYSLADHRVFAKLPKNGRRVGTAEIVKAYGDDWEIQDQKKYVAVVMARLIDKVEANKEPFKICKNMREPGQNRIEYWIETRKSKRNGK